MFGTKYEPVNTRFDGAFENRLYVDTPERILIATDQFFQKFNLLELKI